MPVDNSSARCKVDLSSQGESTFVRTIKIETTMKELRTPLVKLVLPTAISLHQLATAALVSFDDLSPGVDWIDIPSGYASLNWTNFGALIGSFRPISEGYRVGTISPQNVAFNKYGDPAEISASGSFNLVSAYVTAAYANPTTLTVLGYSGAIQIYNGSFSITKTIPSQINFDYLGVTRVRFIVSPSTPFALDDLVVTGIATQTNTPVPTNSAAGTVDLGVVTVSTLGHEHKIQPYRLSDLLIDQDQSSGGGGTLPTVSIDWATNSHFKLTVAAPSGMKFLIVPPGGVSAFFDGLLWWQSVRGGQTAHRDSAVTFTGLEGTPPNLTGTESVLSVFDGFVGWSAVPSTSFTNALAFTSMTLAGVGGPWNTGFGTTTFTPRGNSFLRVSYLTSAMNDPGPFVSIVPLNQPLPALSITIQPNGDVELTFNGVLQSASNPGGPFQDVPGNPSGSHLVSKANLGTQQLFRARIN